MKFISQSLGYHFFNTQGHIVIKEFSTKAASIKEIRLKTNSEFGELRSLFACSQVRFTSARYDVCHDLKSCNLGLLLDL